MNLKTKLTLVLATAVSAVSGLAQTTNGTLGLRYVSAELTVIDPSYTKTNGYDVAIGVNLPVSANLDVSFGYDYDWLNVQGVHGRDHTLSAAAVAYAPYAGVKPFAAVGLDYSWSSIKSGGYTVRDDAGGWAVGAGVEIPAGVVTVTPSIAYHDGFRSDATGSTQYGVTVDHWFSAKVNGYVGLAYADANGSSVNVWGYSAGVRLRF